MKTPWVGEEVAKVYTGPAAGPTGAFGPGPAILAPGGDR